jgi:hypothetical protein
MATWTAYIIAVLTWIAWMIGFAILDLALGDHILPLASDLGGDFVADQVGWMHTVLGNWAILGAIGILVALIAAAVYAPGGAST